MIEENFKIFKFSKPTYYIPNNFIFNAKHK